MLILTPSYASAIHTQYPSFRNNPMSCNQIFRIPGFYDPNSKRLVGVIYRPSVWLPGTVYYVRSEDTYDVVIPTNFEGLYFKVIDPGKSGVTEPEWPLNDGDIVEDGSVRWQAVHYDLLIPEINVVASTYTATNGVVMASSAFGPNNTQAMIFSVPAGVEDFVVTNHTVKSNGEEDDVSMRFVVGET